MQCHVIYNSDIIADLKSLLDEDDLAIILRSKHRPRCIIEFISRSIQLLHIEEARRCVMVNSSDLLRAILSTILHSLALQVMFMIVMKPFALSSAGC